MKFLIQIIKGEEVFQIQHDFVFELEHALKYWNWRNEEHDILHCSLDDLHGLKSIVKDIRQYTPIGTIEFVMKFIDLYVKKGGSKKIKPLNVPEHVLDPKYSGRKIINRTINKDTRQSVFDELNTFKSPLYIKSNDVIKDSMNGSYYTNHILDELILPDGNYQISEHQSISSEYRCFVYKGKLAGIQYYSGDFTQFPNVNSINEIVSKLNNKENEQSGYTFDVYVTSNGETYLMEVHEFFSCGLYGFNDYGILPFMFYRTFQNIKRRLNK